MCNDQTSIIIIFPGVMHGKNCLKIILVKVGRMIYTSFLDPSLKIILINFVRKMKHRLVWI